MRLSEYSFFLLKDSEKLKKLLAGATTARPDTDLNRGGTLVIRIPHEDKYLLTKQGEIMSFGNSILSTYTQTGSGIVQDYVLC